MREVSPVPPFDTGIVGRRSEESVPEVIFEVECECPATLISVQAI